MSVLAAQLAGSSRSALPPIALVIIVVVAAAAAMWTDGKRRPIWIVGDAPVIFFLPDVTSQIVGRMDEIRFEWAESACARYQLSVTRAALH